MINYNTKKTEDARSLNGLIYSEVRLEGADHMSKKKIIITVLFISIMFIFGLICYKSVEKKSMSTNTTSTNFKSSIDKVGFLKKYLTFYSDILDTEYIIIYRDNSKGLIKGPSDWDMRVVMKVNKASINKWTKGLDKVDDKVIDLNWWNKVPIDNENWKLSSKPEFYKKKGERVYLVVYDQEGIILKMVTTYGDYPKNQ